MSYEPLSVLRMLSAQSEADQMRELLHDVLDPELGVNIVDLGLVYGVEVDGRAVDVLITTTTPACPLGEYITDEVRRVLLDSGAVDEVRVEITHTPPWEPEMVSADIKEEFGWA